MNQYNELPSVLDKDFAQKLSVNTVINFCYFTANFPYDFIEVIWGEQPLLVNHLRSKLKATGEGIGNYVTCGDFMNFFFELDRGNQLKLVTWINENYNGIYC